MIFLYLFAFGLIPLLIYFSLTILFFKYIYLLINSLIFKHNSFMCLYHVLQKANGEECRNKHAKKSNIKCISSVINLENVWESKKKKKVKQVT